MHCAAAIRLPTLALAHQTERLERNVSRKETISGDERAQNRGDERGAGLEELTIMGSAVHSLTRTRSVLVCPFPAASQKAVHPKALVAFTAAPRRTAPTPASLASEG
eukprot:2482221-Rhodomonas_salina.1